MARCPECRATFEDVRQAEQTVRALELRPESIQRHSGCGHVDFYRGLGGPIIHDPPLGRPAGDQQASGGDVGPQDPQG